MKKTYLNPSCKMMAVKSEGIMVTTVTGGDGGPGWGGAGDGGGGDVNQINVWGEEEAE